MYLKRIEVFGFKSFADKTEIELNNGISAIVGPNGSGKSNISDAIRWVMGEQSIKTLRGNKLEDVIFVGSERRKPLGYAEVNLILDNNDGYLPLNYSEVVITRRFYRSGESQFLINKNECRLKDIQELMLDTGLGKEAYSIIGQGRVEEILSSSPEERRSVFEEAAGIVKYKLRQRDAVRKLAEAEQNLLRLSDLLQEIGAQLPYLEQQAEKTERFNQLDSQCRELEKRLALSKWHKASSHLQELQQHLHQWQDQCSQHQSELLALETDGEIEQQRLMQLEQITNEKQGLKTELVSQQSTLERKIGIGQEKIRSWEENIEKVERELAELEQQLIASLSKEAIASGKYESLEEEVAVVSEQLKNKELQYNQLKLESTTFTQRLEQDKHELIELLNEEAKIKNQLHKVRLEKEQCIKAIDKLEEQMNSKTRYQETMVMKIQELQGQMQLGENSKYELDQELEATKRVITQREVKIKDLHQHRNKTHEQLQIISARLKSLRELEQQKTGYNQGVKQLLKAKEKGTGFFQEIYGTIADLITVKMGFEKAIEVALGAGVQYVVTDNEDVAQQAVRFLKQGKHGRVTFLPLNLIMPGNPIPVKQFEGKHPGFIGLGLDLISYDSQISKAAQYMLSRVIVVKDLNTAVLLSKQIPKNGRVVTIDGDVVNATGTITGGSWQNSKTGGLLTRKREIFQVSAELSKLTDQLTQYDLDIQAQQQELDDLKIKLTHIEEQNVQCKINNDGIKQEIHRSGVLIKENDDQIKLLTLELEHLLKEKQLGQEEVVHLEGEVENKKALSDVLREHISHAQEKIETDAVNYSQLMEDVTELKVKIATLEERLLSHRETLKNTEQGSMEIKRKIKNKKEESTYITRSKQQLIEELDEASKQLLEVIEKYRAVEGALTTSQQERVERLLVWQTMDQKIKTSRKQQADLERKIGEYEIKTAETETDLRYLNQILIEQYHLNNPGVTINNNPSLIQLKGDVNRQIVELRDEIDLLQPVNLGAIEELSRIKERYQFLLQQQDDLLKGKKGLIKVIHEMEARMEKQFLDAFSKIHDNFSLVFGQLFGGGKAELLLTDDGSPLTSGIEIVVQPPGKKQQNLTLLSGGEKALTAIALLFAVLRVKTSPFCVLDEIDAALDDTNVQRFAEYLQKHAPKGQYIIITHQRGTMVAADILYGVTMQEAGISKIVSVKLPEEVKVAG